MTPVGPQHKRSADHPYELIDLPMSALTIDPSYQREFRRTSMTKIVKNFDPNLFDPLVVNMRQDGNFWLVRGQHRRAALMELRGDDALGPCIVYMGLTKEEESAVFYTEDSLRRRLTPSDRWAARIQAKEKAAVDIERIAAQSGWKINARAQADERGSIRAIGAIDRAYTHYGGVAFSFGLSLLHALGLDGPPSAGLIAGMIQFVSMYRAERNYTTKAAEAALRKTGAHKLEAMAEDRRRVDKCTPQTAYCKELVLAFNKGKHEGARLTPYELKINSSWAQRDERYTEGGGGNAE